MSNKKVAFFTLGCKLNFAETSTISRFFTSNGFEIVKFADIADYYIINSCTVTSNANKKSRNAISRARKKNAKAVIIVTGCYAQLKDREIEDLHLADYIIGANDKAQIETIIEKHSDLIQFKYLTDHKNVESFFPAYSMGDRTRSFLKIQDGCDYFCAYCTIPYARGRSINESIKSIIKNAENIALGGIKEIILTGVNIGDFGKSTGENLFELLKELVKISGIERIRIGSIEPNLLEDRIINLIASEKKLMPHFHIPLQSGSDEVLKLIRRRYSTDLFRKKIETIKELIPEAFIGIDLIVGLNGETETHFNQTIDFINSLDISFIHHFQYSEREGTSAINFSPKPSSKIKKERAEQIANISDYKHKIFLESFIGKDSKVLFESSKKEGKIYGYTDNYIRVCIKYDKSLINRIVDVKILEFYEDDILKVNLK